MMVAFPGTSCQATIKQFLRDNPGPLIEALIMFAPNEN